MTLRVINCHIFTLYSINGTSGHHEIMSRLRTGSHVCYRLQISQRGWNTQSLWKNELN